MSKIKCPYCEHMNNGQMPFCANCGRVLPMGDERQVMAETIGASFEFKWVLVGIFVIFILSSAVIFSFKAMGVDLSFMQKPEGVRLDEPGITDITPAWTMPYADSPITIGIRTRGKKEYTASHAVAVKYCDKSTPIISSKVSSIKPVKLNVLGIPFTIFKVPQEEAVKFIPPKCEKEGFYNIKVKFDNGKYLKKQNAIYVADINHPWYLLYTEQGLDVLEKVLNSKLTKTEDLVDNFKEAFAVPTEDIIKLYNKILKEKESMKMLSFGFWGLFILELLAFLIGGMISSRLSPGITIKESLLAGILTVILIVLRNTFLFGAGGSFMIFQLLIMATSYTAAAAMGGYLGEKWQGTLIKKKI